MYFLYETTGKIGNSFIAETGNPQVQDSLWWLLWGITFCVEDSNLLKIIVMLPHLLYNIKKSFKFMVKSSGTNIAAKLYVIKNFHWILLQFSRQNLYIPKIMKELKKQVVVNIQETTISASRYHKIWIQTLLSTMEITLNPLFRVWSSAAFRNIKWIWISLCYVFSDFFWNVPDRRISKKKSLFRRFCNLNKNFIIM